MTKQKIKEEKIKNLRVKENLWWRLSKVKVNKKLKSIEAVIEFLLKDIEK